MRNNYNINSFLFTGILLALVLFFNTDSDAKNDLSYQENIKNSSLTASAKSLTFNSSEEFVKDQKDNSALKSENEEKKPIKKESIGNPVLTTEVAFVKDLESKKELFGLSTEKRWPIASITKLITGIVALEKISPDKIVPISQSAIDIDDSKLGNLSAGENYSIKDLVKIMLFISNNKAATAIAEFYGQEKFIDEMNLEAKKIGMTQTEFSDPTGLSFQNQSTTEDLTKLTEYILKEKPEIFEYVKSKEMWAVELKSNLTKFFTNINYFSGREDFLGGKTGFIDSSGENLLSVFNYQGHKILVIVLGSENRFSDTETLFEWVKKSYEF